MFLGACGSDAQEARDRCGEGEPCEPPVTECGEREAPAAAGCRAAGIPADACGEGFRWDGAASCEAVLPLEPCPDGKIAIPGDTTCRDLAPCGDGTWGEVPTDAETVHVDAAYAGGASDGSASRPFSTLTAALSAAPAGALVALAAGTYTGSVEVRRPVRIAGRCPDLVEIVGTGPPAILVQATAEIHGVSLTGPSVGILVAHATGVRVSSVRVHDVGDLGIDAESTGPATELTVVDTLVESCAGAGINVFGATVHAERVHVRGTKGRPDRATSGNGFSILRHPSNPATEPRVTITRSLVEGNHSAGIFARAASVVIDGTVVRDTRPSPVTDLFGAGVLFFGDPAAGRRGSYELRRSVVERNVERGVAIAFADGSVEHTVVAGTASRAVDGELGTGIEVSEEAVATLTESVVRDNRSAGVAVAGSSAKLEALLVLDTSPSERSGAGGYGIVSQRLGAAPSTVFATECVIARSVLVGCAAFGSRLELVRSAVRETRPLPDGTFGDGIGGSAVGPDAPADVLLEGALVTGSARAGAVVFGSSLRMTGTRLQCNALDLDVERAFVGGERDYALHDQGGNECGCGAKAACVAQSASLAPTPAPTDVSGN